MKNVYLLPYKNGSKSCSALAEQLGVLQIRNKEGMKPFTRGSVVINWGSSAPKRILGGQTILNKPEAVSKAINKLTTMRTLNDAGVSVPPFCESREEAVKLFADGRAVVCRTVLNGYGGAGIVIAESEAQLVDAPLYAGYMPKKDEYRIHVFRGEVIFIQRKARKLDVPDDKVNWKVRNLEGGFIYAHQNVEVEAEVKDQAVRAVSALCLDFGAVDILVTPRGKPFVLEVNTACGLQGASIEKYKEALEKFVRSEHSINVE